MLRLSLSLAAGILLLAGCAGPSDPAPAAGTLTSGGAIVTGSRIRQDPAAADPALMTVTPGEAVDSVPHASAAVNRALWPFVQGGGRF